MALLRRIFFIADLSLPSVPKEANEAWYVVVPVGKNVLAKMVPEMCQEVGITGKKTNHSLRVSGATTLFDSEVLLVVIAMAKETAPKK